MANNGFIFVSNANKILNMCLKAASFVKKVLYVKVYDNVKYTTPLTLLSQEIVNIYSRGLSDFNNLDIRLMLDTGKKESIHTSFPIDQVMCDSDLITKGRNLSKTIATLNDDYKETTVCSYGNVPNISCVDDIKTYGNVIVGGVFDRLHNGHKILLSQAALRATQHLTVAVTDAHMLHNKTLWELIEPISKRKEVVTNFLQDIKPDLCYCVISVHDTFGPTVYDPNLQMIVVSEETNWGAEKVNEYRQHNGMCLLDRHVIDLIKDTTPKKFKKEETKISSCNERMRILGTLIKTPKPNDEIPETPYVVGVMGGIGSGKTTLSKMLQEKGAAFLECDKIVDDMLAPGQPLNATVAKILGKQVVVKPTGVIDRNVLGQIINKDEIKLDEMNEQVFPIILDEIQQQISLFGADGYDVVVIESSVMLKTGWYEMCHQLWTVIVPPEEAVVRAMDTQEMSEVQARQLIEQQPSNSEYVELANIVFSSQWTYGYLQTQVDRAWASLQSFLKGKYIGLHST